MVEKLFDMSLMGNSSQNELLSANFIATQPQYPMPEKQNLIFQHGIFQYSLQLSIMKVVHSQ